MSTTSKPVLWVGRVLSALPVLMLTFSAVMKFSRSPQVMEGFVGKFGYPEGTLLPIGVVELFCALVYAVPRTSALGAILITGYMGGATATHVRVSDPWFMAVLLGVVAWAGLYLREPRLRALLPLRTTAD
jgi:hypothetical protein